MTKTCFNCRYFGGLTGEGDVHTCSKFSRYRHVTFNDANAPCPNNHVFKSALKLAVEKIQEESKCK